VTVSGRGRAALRWRRPGGRGRPGGGCGAGDRGVAAGGGGRGGGTDDSGAGGGGSATRAGGGGGGGTGGGAGVAGRAGSTGRVPDPDPKEAISSGLMTTVPGTSSGRTLSKTSPSRISSPSLRFALSTFWPLTKTPLALPASRIARPWGPASTTACRREHFESFRTRSHEGSRPRTATLPWSSTSCTVPVEYRISNLTSPFFPFPPEVWLILAEKGYGGFWPQVRGLVVLCAGSWHLSWRGVASAPVIGEAMARRGNGPVSFFPAPRCVVSSVVGMPNLRRPRHKP
jgi:hypothetical protein